MTATEDRAEHRVVIDFAEGTIRSSCVVTAKSHADDIAAIARVLLETRERVVVSMGHRALPLEGDASMKRTAADHDPLVSALVQIGTVTNPRAEALRRARAQLDAELRAAEAETP